MNDDSNSRGGAGQPTSARTGERRAEILVAARAVLRERGFHATRLADVGARLGLTAPAVAYYFPSRTGLLVEALLSAEQERFYAGVEPALEQLPAAADRLRLALGSALESTDWVLWFELCSLALRDADARSGLERIEHRWHALLAAILERGAHRGEWELTAPADELAVRLAALVDGLSIQVVLRDLPLERVRAGCARWLAVELGL